MKGPRQSRTHTLPPTAPLSQKVGGHAGVHVTEDESLLLKPALPREIAFYQLIRDITDASTGLHRLKDWIPKFFGLLTLEGKLADPTAESDTGSIPTIIPTRGLESTSLRNIDQANGTVTSGIPGPTLVLQNLLHGYCKPCILDIKLGTVLYDEDASEEKKVRMIKKAAESTTLTTGMRLTGFQVYPNHSPDPIVYGREYGYSLKPEQLQEGIQNYFPCSATNAGPEASSSSNLGTGLPANTLSTLLTSLLGALTDLRECLAGAHVRMVGCSVLIIYEGDWERAAAASSYGGGPGNAEEVENREEEEGEEGEGESDQIEIELNEQGGIVVESIPGEILEESSEDSSVDQHPRLYTISLIDFAHTRIVPGEGPDQGVLMGMDTLIRLVDCRRQQVVALVEAERIR